MKGSAILLPTVHDSFCEFAGELIYFQVDTK